ncbi:MAG: peptidase M50 [Candidatus Viridilinea halotolerans]|uniref:Peptidase M50 n=1 Tax=Candidatus Viridilinea halotolerans TaxID=2491704 RepID=A0A426U631_9CHLR|nr:MAG: peptidase M50 [Candidatus Viridilinea halotolerans]
MFATPSDEASLYGRNDNIELLKAWAGTSLAFGIFMVSGQVFSSNFMYLLAIAAFTCGLGFLLHELAHRVVARKFGAEAHFVANNGWLVISIIVAFFPVFIAAPGAVWHRGYLTARQGGLIALAGPVTNLVLALGFLLLIEIIPPRTEIFGIQILLLCAVGHQINAWLGLFNMIPAGPFDGAKVLAWDWRVFAVTVAAALLLVFGV